MTTRTYFFGKAILIAIIILSIGITACNTGSKEKKLFTAAEVFPVPERPVGQTHVLELRTEPIDTVRIAIIGLGMRGQGAVYRLSYIDGTKIVALADVVPASVEEAQKTLKELGRPEAVGYTGTDDWKTICERDDIDLVYVCTHWDLHTPIAVYAMEHGKHAAIEVPAALTIDEA